MQINKETKLAIGDKVFFMHQNAVLEGVVKAVIIEIAQDNPDVVTYGVIPTPEDCKKIPEQMTPAAYVPEAKAFATKEELIESL
mgnify:CR=1 FL=1